MADVTEVIHKITYEVNNEALENASKAIQFQLSELDKLGKSLVDYTKQLNKVTYRSSTDIDVLSGKIGEVNTKIAAGIAKTEGVFQQAGKGILKGLDVSEDVKGLMTKVFTPIKTELDKIGRGGKVSFADLGKSLFTFTNALDLGINALKLLGEEIFTVDGALNGLTVSQKNMIQVSERALTMYASEKVHLELLNEEVINETTSQERLKEIRDEMVNSYPGLANNLSGETNLRLKLADSIGKVNEALVLNAKVKAAEELLVENEKKFLSQEVTLWEGFVKSMYNAVLGPAGAINYAANKTKEYFERRNDLIDIIKKGNNELRQSGVSGIFSSAEPQVYTPKTQRPATGLPEKESDPIQLDFSPVYDEEQVQHTVEEITDIIIRTTKEAVRKETDSIKLGEQQLLLDLEKEYGKGLKTLEQYEKEKENILTKSRQRQIEAELKGLQVMQSEYKKDSEDFREITARKLALQIESEQLRNKHNPEANEEKSEQQKGLTEEQRNNIKEGIDGYQLLAQAAAEAYDTILQAQIAALDKEISIREKRVEEAKKLAERGNTEALRLEEERLRKAQEQRERFARQQQAVNAAITVSNAIAAVARAALEGGGFGSVATIAALIAALAAGYAAVTSMSNENSFADGVVGYHGIGGPRDDKNRVRISNGESVITAEGTRKNRSLLEAINKGAVLHMIDPSLPLIIPMFKQPASHNNNQYAATKDLKRLESKLDEVVGAIEDNKLKQNIFFNEQGVGIMTERAMQRDRKRWK